MPDNVRRTSKQTYLVAMSSPPPFGFELLLRSPVLRQTLAGAVPASWIFRYLVNRLFVLLQLYPSVTRKRRLRYIWVNRLRRSYWISSFPVDFGLNLKNVVRDCSKKTSAQFRKKFTPSFLVCKMSVLAQPPLSMSVGTHYKFRKIRSFALKVRAFASEESPLSAKCRTEQPPLLPMYFIDSPYWCLFVVCYLWLLNKFNSY